MIAEGIATELAIAVAQVSAIAAALEIAGALVIAAGRHRSISVRVVIA